MTTKEIKKPVKVVFGSGIFPTPEPKIFRPIRSYYHKLYLKALVILMICFLTIEFRFIFFLDHNFSLIELIYLGIYILIFISLLFLIPIRILINHYVHSFEYLVHGHEVVVKKGLLNKTEKHVPFRNVTHIKTRYGIFDRLFGIGTIEIQTAGVKGKSRKPEEKIEGIVVYREVAYYILNQIKRIEHTTKETIEQEIFEKDDLTNDFWLKFYNQVIEIKKLCNK
ncbi:MAG: PH domain-containing protein [Candidatus Hodarchaeales archaeon]|jgi:membrane protein YdbS with pleckstrin-like domain